MKHSKKEKTLTNNFNLPSYLEIPDVGLYLDQVVKYLNSYFDAYDELIVTSSMITNYIKHNIVKRVNKKTYTRNQIALFIFIILTKSVLSMDNIKRIISDIKDDEIEKLYISFRDKLLKILISFDEKGNSLIKLDDKYALINNIVITIGHKFYLERNITKITFYE